MEGYLLDAVKVYGNNTAQYLYHSFGTLLVDPERAGVQRVLAKSNGESAGCYR